MIGAVTLIDSMGHDLRIVNAARVSFKKKSDALSASDIGVINYMMRNQHGTPFEHVVFTFHVECFIGVAREWFRHRISSFNEVSTRYVEMEPEFYIPDPEAMRAQVGKVGDYAFETMTPEDAARACRLMAMAYDEAYDMYKQLLGQGVAKELARNVLPLGLMTQFYWTVNLRSLFNFLNLRTASSALLEIRELANEVEGLARPVAPGAFAAWEQHGRVAP